MEYPKINLSLEALRARQDESIENLDLREFGFFLETFNPESGGSGHFHGDNHSVNFKTMDELCEIVVNQADLPAEAFYYQDAMATCDEIEHELREDGIHCAWKDQMIKSEMTGMHPARARVCYYIPPGETETKKLAVLRDGTTIANFRTVE